MSACITEKLFENNILLFFPGNDVEHLHGHCMVMYKVSKYIADNFH